MRACAPACRALDSQKWKFPIAGYGPRFRHLGNGAADDDADAADDAADQCLSARAMTLNVSHLTRHPTFHALGQSHRELAAMWRNRRRATVFKAFAVEGNASERCKIAHAYNVGICCPLIVQVCNCKSERRDRRAILIARFSREGGSTKKDRQWRRRCTDPRPRSTRSPQAVALVEVGNAQPLDPSRSRRRR